MDTLSAAEVRFLESADIGSSLMLQGKTFAFRAGYSKLCSFFYSTSISSMTPFLNKDIGSGVEKFT
jgi:hypothetical protein